jgi:hypothetical protein
MVQITNFNSRCEQVRRNITNEINTCGLPIAPIYYIIKDLARELENLYYGALNSEAAEKEEKISEITSEEEEDESNES